MLIPQIQDLAQPLALLLLLLDLVCKAREASLDAGREATLLAYITVDTAGLLSFSGLKEFCVSWMVIFGWRG